jgi:hypothetical protein
MAFTSSRVMQVWFCGDTMYHVICALASGVVRAGAGCSGRWCGGGLDSLCGSLAGRHQPLVHACNKRADSASPCIGDALREHRCRLRRRGASASDDHRRRKPSGSDFSEENLCC